MVNFQNGGCCFHVGLSFKKFWFNNKMNWEN